MRLVYCAIILMMIFVSACAQQGNEQQPSTQGMPAYGSNGDGKEKASDTEAAEVKEGKNDTKPDNEENEYSGTKSNEVRMLGAGKYDPLETKISKGGTIAFFNDGKLKTVVTIEGKGKIINTPIIQPGEKYEQAFAESGTYEYWGVSYGPGGATIIVE